VIFVDTSFYAVFTEEDDNHQRAVEAFKEREDRRLPELLPTTNHIVFETITLTRMSGKDKAGRPCLSLGIVSRHNRRSILPNRRARRRVSANTTTVRMRIASRERDEEG
jgi:hypothetical protein